MPLALGDESKSESECLNVRALCYENVIFAAAIDQQFIAWLRNVLTMLSQPNERLDKLVDQMYAKCR